MDSLPETPFFDREFAGTARCVGQARRCLVAALAATAAMAATPYGVRCDTDAVALVATELMNNAVQHSRSKCSTFRLLARLREDTVRISVVDRGALPLPRPRGPLDRRPEERGRGLQIVTALADRCGVTGHGNGGCETWAELPLIPAWGARSETETRP